MSKTGWQKLLKELGFKETTVPQHPNCRCIFNPVSNELDKSIKKYKKYSSKSLRNKMIKERAIDEIDNETECYFVV